jgi:hypothetical protein
MSSALPQDLVQRVSIHRTDIQRTQHLLAVHARDLMMDVGADPAGIRRVQDVRAHLEAAVSALGQALREATGDG